MQEKQNNIQPEQVKPENTVSIGALLVNARNKAALSQADVADQINLTRYIISALEKDDFEQLPESTYVRGYLRNYAKAVGIDAEELVSVYNKQHHVESEVATRTSSKHSYDATILWSTAAVFTILVGLLVNWWMDESKIPEQNVEVVSNDSSASASGDESENLAQTQDSIHESNNDNIEQISEQSSPQAENLAINSSVDEVLNSDVEQAMEDESLNPNLVTLSDGSDILTVTYVEKSWTEIRDADLNPLMQGLIEPGVVRNLSGKAPFYIFLGNSPGVVIEVNGQYFDQSQFNRSNRTARFQISNGSLN